MSRGLEQKTKTNKKRTPKNNYLHPLWKAAIHSNIGGNFKYIKTQAHVIGWRL